MRLKIDSNPYTSTDFTEIWLKHFSSNKLSVTLPFISNLKFIKSKFPRVYQNVGKNLTNGISYQFQECSELNDFKDVLIIRDVPEYFYTDFKKLPDNFKLLNIRQYQGYLANFDGHKTIDAYLFENFKSKSRWQINKHVKKLNSCFDLRFEILYGTSLSDKEFNYIFDIYRNLLERRFDDKKMELHYLQDKTWNYIKEIFFQFIPKKKAVLFILYANDKLIAVNSNIVSDKIVFSFLPSFDIDYSKFNIGVYMTKNILDWCIKNNFQGYDFSKGEFEYKDRWSNQKYNFRYHILYNRKAIGALVISKTISVIYSTWQYLRDKRIHIYYRKFNFLVKNVSSKRNLNKKKFSFADINDESIQYDKQSINLSAAKNHYLLIPVFNFAWKHSLPLKEITIYEILKHKKHFLISTPQKSKILIFQ